MSILADANSLVAAVDLLHCDTKDFLRLAAARPAGGVLHHGRYAVKIWIKSNFVVPGLKETDSVSLDSSPMNLRQFLIELAGLAPTRIEYVRPGAAALNPDDWEVEINGIPYQKTLKGLDTLLNDGDTVTINILAFGGG